MAQCRKENVLNLIVRKQTMIFMLRVMNNSFRKEDGLYTVFGNMLLSMKAWIPWNKGWCDRPLFEEWSNSIGSCSWYFESWISTSSHRNTITKVPLLTTLLILVLFLNCGRYFTFCIPTFLLSKLEMRLKWHSIWQREHTTQNSLNQRVHCFRRWCCDEWRPIWMRLNYLQRKNCWFMSLWLHSNGISYEKKHELTELQILV